MSKVSEREGLGKFTSDVIPESKENRMASLSLF